MDLGGPQAVKVSSPEIFPEGLRRGALHHRRHTLHRTNGAYYYVSDNWGLVREFGLRTLKALWWA